MESRIKRIDSILQNSQQDLKDKQNREKELRAQIAAREKQVENDVCLN